MLASLPSLVVGRMKQTVLNAQTIVGEDIDVVDEIELHGIVERRHGPVKPGHDGAI